MLIKFFKMGWTIPFSDPVTFTFWLSLLKFFGFLWPFSVQLQFHAIYARWAWWKSTTDCISSDSGHDPCNPNTTPFHTNPWATSAAGCQTALAATPTSATITSSSAPRTEWIQQQQTHPEPAGHLSEWVHTVHTIHTNELFGLPAKGW